MRFATEIGTRCDRVIASNVVYRYRDLTPLCAMHMRPHPLHASCFIGELVYVIRYARHLTPFLLF
jgi:hypothetical protein